MKKSIVIVSLLACASFSAFAQGTAKANAKHELTAEQIATNKETSASYANMLQKKLSLSQEQVTAVADIECASKSALDVYLPNRVPADALDRIMATKDDKMKKILTAAQYKEYKALFSK